MGVKMFFFDLVWVKLYTMSPLVFPRSLYTGLDNDVSKFSMVNESGEGVGFFPKFTEKFPWEY